MTIIQGVHAVTIRHFRIFIAVANTGSVTKAAEALFITQPTISVAIKEMEEHYGVRFFDRINQRLKITEEGTAMLGYATHLISLHDEIEKTFQNPDALGVLRVGASINVGSIYMPDFVLKFKSAYPNGKVRVRVTTTDILEKLLLENQIDLAIAGGVFHSKYIKLHPLFAENYVAVCSPSHPLAGMTVTLEEFMSQPLLFRERDSGPYEVFQAALNRAGYSVEPEWESSSQAALLEAAYKGLGVTILPLTLAAQQFEQGLLSPVNFSDFTFTNTVYLAYHSQKFISPAMNTFIDIATGLTK